LRKLSCDTDNCKKLVYYVEESCEGIDLAYCKKHGDDYQINTIMPDWIKLLKSKIRSARKHLKCQNSKEGHKFPPPPAENPLQKHDSLIYGVSTLSTMSMLNGTEHTCTKCGFTYWDPSSILNFNINENSITNIGDVLPKIDVPRLVYTSPTIHKVLPR